MKEKLLGYYGLKEGEKVTFRTLLGKSSIEVISKVHRLLMRRFKLAIEALPGLDLKSFDLNKYGNLDTAIDFDGSFAASLGTPKGSADNLKKLAQGSGCQINCYREYPSMQKPGNRRLVF